MKMNRQIGSRFTKIPIRGYLHIGHAKAALLSDYFAHQAYDGKLRLRLDEYATPFNLALDAREINVAY